MTAALWFIWLDPRASPEICLPIYIFFECVCVCVCVCVWWSACSSSLLMALIRLLTCFKVLAFSRRVLIARPLVMPHLYSLQTFFTRFTPPVLSLSLSLSIFVIILSLPPQLPHIQPTSASLFRWPWNDRLVDEKINTHSHTHKKKKKQK